MIKMRIVGPALALTLAAALLAACGGGGADTTPRTTITSVKTFGDSLADAGTFGVRFTIQPSAGNPNYIYPELVAQQYGIAATCNFYAATSLSTFVNNPKAGCVNYAIGGGRINGAGAGFGPPDPRVVGVQLAAATATGNFAANDLLLIVGGGNDAADLSGAFLFKDLDASVRYKAFLSTVLTKAQVDAAAANGAPGLAAVGGTYMVALADRFYDSIKTSALDKGAQKIVLINMPGITNTPRFQALLTNVAAMTAAAGGDGAVARAQAEVLIKSWVVAFNTQLATRVGNDSRIALVDLYSNFNDQVANKAQYKITEVEKTACPAKAQLGSDGLPDYDFPTCTDAALAANKPSGVTASDWYKSYMFSDGFHPTPYGHQLASQLIARSLAQKGWL